MSSVNDKLAADGEFRLKTLNVSMTLDEIMRARRVTNSIQRGSSERALRLARSIFERFHPGSDGYTAAVMYAIGERETASQFLKRDEVDAIFPPSLIPGINDIDEQMWAAIRYSDIDKKVRRGENP